MELSEELQSVLHDAYEQAYIARHEVLTPEHTLAALLKNSTIREILVDCGVRVAEVVANTEAYLKKSIPVSDGDKPTQSAMFQKVFHGTLTRVSHVERETVEAYDLLVEIFENKETSASHFLLEAGLTPYHLLRRIAHGGEDGKRYDGDDADGQGESATTAPSSTESTKDDEGSKQQEAKKSTLLDRYTTNLTLLAQQGKLDPLIGRADIIERTMHVLGRRRKNNPVHVGDPGVGKTAITEGLAARIVSKDAPHFLQGYAIYSLDMASIVAGTRYRGDFEERMKQLIASLEQEQKVIVFIDEIHTIVGAGAGLGSPLDASNMLKPLLAAGNIRCIGATTHEEYRRYFEKDRALSRRFQRIDVPELSEEESLQVIKGLSSYYEKFHNVRYSDGALRAATHLSAQYINDRFLPDKVIDVIDECGAAIKMRHSHTNNTSRTPMVVDENLVEEIVARIAHIPQKSVTQDEQKQLKNLEQELGAVVFGQQDAVKAVADAVKRGRAGFRTANKPVASFLFVGPTGVGKTELSGQLATVLGVQFLRFDMSEYQERHTMSRLIGSPPGYVGYDEGAQLTDSIRKSPHSVLLLDEIEKAHYDIQHILLQIMDYATVTDNTGRKADFRNVILIMTSNAGARDIGKQRVGFEGKMMHHEATDEAVRQLFSPEFRGRIDRVVNFNQLDRDVITSVVKREIALFNAQLNERNIVVSLTPRALGQLAMESETRDAGARAVQRIVEERIRAWFVDEVLFGKLAGGGRVRVDYKQDAFHFTIKRLAAASTK